MLLSFDRAGFPLLRLPGWKLAFHLLPVTKWQLEPFLAEPNGYGDAWYSEVLAVNPRIALPRLTARNREQLFVTGILPSEALAFAHWMGPGFDLPTVEEWRSLYRQLQEELFPADIASWLSPEQCNTPIATLLTRLHEQLRPRTWLDMTLMQDGLVEWVCEGERWAGLGSPRHEFQPNLYAPLRDLVLPNREDARLSFFGFRLVQRENR